MDKLTSIYARSMLIFTLILPYYVKGMTILSIFIVKQGFEMIELIVDVQACLQVHIHSFIPQYLTGEEHKPLVFINIYRSLTLRYILQAFVGVAKDLNAIVIAFRGTQESRLEFVVIFLSFICSIVFRSKLFRFFKSG